MPRPRKRLRTRTGRMVDTREYGISAKDPFANSPYLKQFGAYIDQWDPEKLSVQVMLKMLHHPAIALANHMIDAPLINAEWEIQYADQDKRRFMQAVIERIYLKLMLFSLPSVSLGFAAFTKQWGQHVPFDKEGNALWPKNLLVID